MRFLCFAAAFVLAAITRAQTICIDPGHPSENGIGTHGQHISEVKAAWLVSLRLRQLLLHAGYKVVLTKKSELEKVTNKRRAEIANQARASLMLRIHCDAGSRSGFASYYPAALGRVGEVVGPSQDVLDSSLAAAKAFHPAVIKALKGAVGDRGLHTDAATMIGKRQGGALTGSIYSKVPTVLIEMAVLQNAHDDAFIATEDGQETMAKAIEAGVEAAVPLSK